MGLVDKEEQEKYTENSRAIIKEDAGEDLWRRIRDSREGNLEKL